MKLDTIRTLTRSSFHKCLHHLKVPNAPDILILGAQKCGTSSLYTFLCQHKDISPGVRKENGFFHRDYYFGKTFEDYKRDFPSLHRNCRFVDATPAYLYHPKCAELLKKYVPDAYFLVILREPLQRAYSAYNHYRILFEKGAHYKPRARAPRRPGHLLWEKLYWGRKIFPSFEECIHIELDMISKNAGFEPALLRRGLYVDQLQNFWKHFPEDKLLILGFRDLTGAPDDTLSRTAEFLRLDPRRWGRREYTPQNTREYVAPMTDEARQLLDDFYAEANRKLIEKIGPLNW